MTKKFVLNREKVNGKKFKKEFIIPDIFSSNPNLIGIETGNQYNTGHIVYTGVNLTVDEVIERAEEFKKMSFWKRRKARKTIKKYLLQIKGAKIGTEVSLTNKYELIKTEKN